jgi:DNA polymerase-3 subunit gamma/tau
MYDEINRKGFEGDTVINGFAEFLRNLLVSSDAKVAMLLEVAEDFKQKYLQTAQVTSLSYIISALNILNEAEINYKLSRNKRLHVELTIIKLCYLQQALELVDNDGTLSKKKLIDGAKTVAFKALPIIKTKNHETNVNKGIQPAEEKNKLYKPAISDAKLIIEDPAAKILPANERSTANNISINNPESEPAVNYTEKSPVNTGKTSIGSLQKIRQQISEKNQLAGSVTTKLLDEEELHKAWGLYINQLKERNNHSAVTNFKMASLQIINENTIEIITSGEIQKAFVEIERAPLIEHFQHYFKNRLLTYQVSIVEIEEDTTPKEQPLTRKQQYLKIIEEYPMVKELKDRLRLELE